MYLLNLLCYDEIILLEQWIIIDIDASKIGKCSRVSLFNTFSFSSQLIYDTYYMIPIYTIYK